MSLTRQKEKIADLEQKIPEVLKELNDTKDTLKNLDAYYERFEGWAREFDSKPHEQRKMIICDLLKRIEIGRGYGGKIFVNEDYQRFIA